MTGIASRNSPRRAADRALSVARDEWLLPLTANYWSSLPPYGASNYCVNASVQSCVDFDAFNPKSRKLVLLRSIDVPRCVNVKNEYMLGQVYALTGASEDHNRIALISPPRCLPRWSAGAFADVLERTARPDDQGLPGIAGRITESPDAPSP